MKITNITTANIMKVLSMATPFVRIVRTHYGMK